MPGSKKGEPNEKCPARSGEPRGTANHLAAAAAFKNENPALGSGLAAKHCARLETRRPECVGSETTDAKDASVIMASRCADS